MTPTENLPYSEHAEMVLDYAEALASTIGAGSVTLEDLEAAIRRVRAELNRRYKK